MWRFSSASRVPVAHTDFVVSVEDARGHAGRGGNADDRIRRRAVPLACDDCGLECCGLRPSGLSWTSDLDRDRAAIWR